MMTECPECSFDPDTLFAKAKKRLIKQREKINEILAIARVLRDNFDGDTNKDITLYGYAQYVVEGLEELRDKEL